MTHGSGPFAELTRLQNELNRIFASLLEGGERAAGAFGQWDPAMDIIDSPNVVRIFLELPGVRPASVTVSVRGTEVTVSGDKQPGEGPLGDRRFHCLERFFGPFSKTFHLNESINSHRGTAALDAGVLIIEFPKVPDLRSRVIVIPVRAGDSPDDSDDTPTTDVSEETESDDARRRTTGRARKDPRTR